MKLLVIKYYGKNGYAINTKNICNIDHIARTSDKDESIEIYYGKKHMSIIDDSSIDSVENIKVCFDVKCFNKDKTIKYDHKEVDNLSEIFNDIINFCTEKDSSVLVIEVMH